MGYDDRKEAERSDDYDEEMAKDSHEDQKAHTVLEDVEQLEQAVWDYTACNPGLTEFRKLLIDTVATGKGPLWRFLYDAAREYSNDR